MLWILAVLAVVAIVVALYIGTATSPVKVASPPPPVEPLSLRNTGTGSPLFQNNDGRKSFITHLNSGDQVWALTAYGPQLLTVSSVNPTNRKAELRNDNGITGSAYLDDSYFSEDYSSHANHGIRSAWRLRTASKQGGSRKYSTTAQRNNRMWIRDESDWGDDCLIDWLIMYHFMFDGFDEPYTHYDGFDVGYYDDLPATKWNEYAGSQTSEDNVPTEVKSETDFNFDEPDNPSDPEPEPYRTPAPEPYSPPADTGGSYDSGSSYDSGGGGFDD